MPAATTFRPSKKLGQNFLIDRNISRKIAALASENLPAGSTIIEIGPGDGALTRELLAHGMRVKTVEVDHRLAERLPQILPNPALSIVRADALDIDWETFFADSGACRIAANLPYSISTEILFRLVESARRWELAVLMLQNEVAARLAARPSTKEYGALSVAMQLQCAVKKEFLVPPQAFRPVPKVQSAVVSLRPLPSAVEGHEARQRSRVVRAAFAYRRKTISNSLQRGLGAGSTETAKLLETAGLDPKSRAESHPPAAFIRLDAAWKQLPRQTATADPGSLPRISSESD
ncbi:MAG: ribosomal RNA small subunit methyltransferase A [Deltaproteobacteria bacterium]|nr:ribosomal RNA small subunit methyltransferase A [Deltaproteobacteria bacterium]